MKLTDYEQPSVTVDLVVFSIHEKKLKVLLVKRGVEPFRGGWALPGGFVHIGESIDAAAKRELAEETGVKGVYLEQLYTWGDVKRDPRGRVISVSYFALINQDSVELRASTDASDVDWFNIDTIPTLAFDHKNVLDYALQRLKWKFEYTPVVFSLLPVNFSLSQLKEIYDIVFEKEFDKRNFCKKISSLGILKEEGMQKGVAFRPAKLYSLKKDVPKVIDII
jgi:8-oxo-dGTP diphosphatase